MLFPLIGPLLGLLILGLAQPKDLQGPARCLWVLSAVYLSCILISYLYDIYIYMINIYIYTETCQYRLFICYAVCIYIYIIRICMSFLANNEPKRIYRLTRL